MASPWKCTVAFILSFPILVYARPNFEKAALILNGKLIVVEVAKNDDQRSYGLMNKEHMNKDEGMLFIFDDEEIRSFWMKNTFIDLSIAYFDKNKKIIDIMDMPASTLAQQHFPTYESTKPAMYALEMNKGWFKKNKIKVGNQFRIKTK